MSVNPNRVVREHSKFLRQLGFTVVDVNRTKRHFKVKVRAGGKTRTLVLSVSASDHRAQVNQEATARRLFREMVDG